MKDSTRPIVEDVWLKSICYMCINCCGIRAHRVNGRVVTLEGDPENPNNKGKMCAKGLSAVVDQYDPKRVTKPLRRSNPEKGIGIDPKWVEISWEDVLDEIVSRLKELRPRNPNGLLLSTFDYGSAGLPHVAFLTSFGSTNTWGSQEYFCGRAYHPVNYMTMGSFFSSIDIERCNYLMLWGTQNGSVVNHLPMKLAREMSRARQRGMKTTVIDPICGYAASRAEEWIPIRPGTDGALALAMLNVLLNELRTFDGEFLKKYSNGPYLVRPDGHYARDTKTDKPLVLDTSTSSAKTYDDPSIGDFALLGSFRVDGVQCSTAFQLLKDHIRKYTPEYSSRITTVPAETIQRLAKEWGENALIGRTIDLDGMTLPLRPVAANFYRGISSHVHGFWNGFAVQLLNVVVGAVDVPGGALSVNCVGFDWEPHEGPEGIIIPAPQSGPTYPSYPARKASKPELLTAIELFPIAHTSGAMFYETQLHRERYKLPYEAEFWFVIRSSVITNTANPNRISEAIKRVKFIVQITKSMDEQSEFADMIIPDTSNLERLDPFPEHYLEFIDGGSTSWYYSMRQPVMNPPAGIVQYPDIFLELARRVGFYQDYIRALNNMAKVISLFKNPDVLDSSKNYSWSGVVDEWAKAAFGSDRNLEWFREHGHLEMRKKTLKEAFPRPFIKPRICIYPEHFIDSGADVRRVTKEMGLDSWDTSDYVALPDWRPCLSYEPGDSRFDLFLSSTKLPFHDGAHTMSNPLLYSLGISNGYAYKVMLNTETAKKKDIRDGDEVIVESEFGYRAEGKVKVTETVHPEVLGVTGTLGLWAKGTFGRGIGIHYNKLLPHELSRIDKLTAGLEGCVRVRILKRNRSS